VRLIVLLIVVTLPVHGFSSVLQRLSMPAHFHRSPPAPALDSAQEHPPSAPHSAAPLAGVADHPHDHDHHHHHHDHSAASTTVQQHSMPDRHHHDGADPSVVYLADDDAPPATTALTKPAFDTFCTLLSSPVLLATAIARGDPPATMQSAHPSHRSSLPDRPPRG